MARLLGYDYPCQACHETASNIAKQVQASQLVGAVQRKSALTKQGWISAGYFCYSFHPYFTFWEMVISSTRAMHVFVNGKRDSILILYDILKITSVNPVSITRVTYGANLNHSSARRYLTHLQSRGLIESVDGVEGKYYSITSKGAEAARELERILRNVGTERVNNPLLAPKR